MKYTTSAVLALAAATATAQDISIFPECSLPCITKAVGKTSCKLTDFACVCDNMDSIKQGATSCVVDACGIDVALNEVLPATEKFCSEVGDGDGDDGGESSSEPAPPATTSSSSATTEAPEEPTPSPTETTEEPSPGPTETPGGGDDEDDGAQPTETTSSPGSIVTPAPTESSPADGGDDDDDDDDDTPPATSSIITAGAAAVGAMGSFGMMLLGAIAAL
ncbi:hypothetical protein VTH82DRAFT_5511 [Thermothelomyces myriococcoides]